MNRWLATSLVGAVALISTIALPLATTARVPSVSILAPTDVTLDATNALTMHLPKAVAAIEGRVLVEAGSAELIGVAPAGPGTALSPVEVAGGYAFGVYGMTVKKAHDLHLVFVPNDSGEIQVRVLIDAVANKQGVRLALSSSDFLSSVQVGRGAGLHAAPNGSPRGAPGRAGGALRALFGRDVISQDDLDIARAAWYSSRSSDTTCADAGTPAGDANGDGCVDIVDLQALSVHQGDPAQGAWAATVGTPTTSGAGNTASGAAGGGSSSTQSLTTGATGLTFVVNSTADTPDALNGDGICADSQGRCTLRAALTESNWNKGHNTIDFNLTGTAPIIIQMGSSPMSLIGSASSSVTIDGYSQPGSRANTAEYGTNAIPGVEVRGNGNSNTPYIFYVAHPDNVIRGLVFANAYRAIFLDTANATGNQIIGNWMGFNRDGSLSNHGHAGVYLNNGASDNLIGTPDLADRNVVGYYDKAIYSYGPGTDGNVIQNNDICISPTGAGASCATGIDYDFGPKDSLVGGTGPHELNVIGPTTLNGIELSHGWDPSTNHVSTLEYQVNDHQVIGNWVGFRADGSYDPNYRSAQNPPSADNGQALHAYDGSNYNLFEANYVAAKYDGVTVAMANSTGNVIHANVIGKSPLGQAAPLGRYGIYFTLYTRGNTVEANEIHNVAAGGIELIDPGVRQIRISRNIVTDTNGPAIYLAPDPNDPTTGANNLLAAPTISSATQTIVAGTGIVDATVEVFQASRDVGLFGLPIAFLGSTTVAGDGHWSLPVTLQLGQRVTATEIVANGNTSSLAANVVVGNNPPPPSADFSWNQQGGTLMVDFTDTSTGQPTSWSWDFGDGTSSNVGNPTKTYATAGDYTVSLTATNASGSDTKSHVVTVDPVDVGTVLASDTFSRSVNSGWDSADIGGYYTLEGNAANFSVAGGAGDIVLPSAGANRSAYLASLSADDVDVKVRLSASKVAAGAAYYVYLDVRRSGNSAYRPKLILKPNGAVSVQASVLDNGSESALGPAVVVAGLTQTANGYVWLRAQVTGSSPTTINVKAWADGQNEPADWQFTAIDDHAAVQGAGAVGVRAYLSSGVSNAPVTFHFDDLTVTQAAPAPPGPVAADAFTRTDSDGWGSADSGGAYSTLGNTANYAVDGSVGTIEVPSAGKSRAALLDGSFGTDVDMTVRVAVDRVAVGGRYFVYAVARRNGSNEYRARLRFEPNGTVAVDASVLNGGSEAPLGSAVVVSGLTQSGGAFIWLRAVISGANPTTIQVKAWADGQAEPPDWQFTATDSHATVQSSGSVGLRTYISSGVTNAPVTFAFDDYSVTAIEP